MAAVGVRRGRRRSSPVPDARRRRCRVAHGHRPVRFDRGAAPCGRPGLPPRRRSAPGARFDGPAIVEERETTAVIRPGWSVEVGADGSLVADAGEERAMTVRTFDPIELEVLWQSLIATVNEQAKALQRAAFSPIVREAGDLANAVFDRRGRMVAQAVTGTPGHINSLAVGASRPSSTSTRRTRWSPGDVLITNDPYKTAGQLLDVTVLVPVFKDGRVDRLLRLDHPPHRRRRLRHRRRRRGTCSRRACGSRSAS